MSSFSGKAAKEAKQYFGELHLKILESFRGLFDDLEANLQQHIDTFGSEVDSSDSAIIKSSYLQEVKEDINEVFEDLEKQDEIIHDTIKEGSDISSATSPSFSDVDEWKKKQKKNITASILQLLLEVFYKKKKKILIRYLKIWRNRTKSSMIQSKKFPIFLLLPLRLFRM